MRLRAVACTQLIIRLPSNLGSLGPLDRMHDRRIAADLEAAGTERSARTQPDGEPERQRLAIR